MGEEIQYSSVVFKGRAAASRNNEEELSVYSSIKSKKPLTSETANQNETISSDYEKGNQKRKKENSPKVQASGSGFHHLLPLGMICFFMCAIIIAVIIYFAMETNRQRKNLSDMTKQLTAEKMFFENQTKEMTVNMTILQNQNEQLRNNNDKINKIQAAIISYTNFPVNLFCPNGVCQTCPKDWIQFQESCYFFYNLNSPWKTWDQSRQFCQNMKSDLVVISSLEEQTFIKNTINYYLDIYHGYWIGLQKVNNKWIWVDGSPDTLGYWKNPGSSEDFTLIVKNATLNKSWFKNRNVFLNRFICEIKALIF